MTRRQDNRWTPNEYHHYDHFQTQIPNPPQIAYFVTMYSIIIAYLFLIDF